MRILAAYKIKHLLSFPPFETIQPHQCLWTNYATNNSIAITAPIVNHHRGIEVLMAQTPWVL